MDLREYQTLAMRTSPDGHDRILNGCMGLIGESGEIVDAVKKWKFQSGENAALPVDKLIDECGDVLWYCAELATGLNTDLSYQAKQHGEWAGMIFSRSFLSRDICIDAIRITQQCEWIFSTLDGRDKRLFRGHINRQDEDAKPHLALILVSVQHFLRTYCTSGIEEAMTRNIEKLRKRYPDGFDPERSLHRAD